MKKRNWTFRNFLMDITATMAEGLYPIVTYLLMLGTSFLFLYSTSDKKSMIIFGIYFLFQIISFIVLYFKLDIITDTLNDISERKKQTKKYQNIVLVFNIVLLFILVVCHLKLFIIALSIIIITSIFTLFIYKINWSYNVWHDKRKPSEDFPIFLVLLILLIPTVMFLIAIFIFTQFSLFIKILLSVLTIIVLIIINEILFSFI